MINQTWLLTRCIIYTFDICSILLANKLTHPCSTLQ